MKLDIFGEPVGFTVDGEGSQKSYLGLLLSLIIFGTIIPFTYQKFSTLRTFGDTKVSDDLDPSGKNLSDRTKIENFSFAISLADIYTK